ncbi:hypothetical protein [Clostridium sp. MD294]|uniref:hypothetical protein n=1 Tax=Clostridium sp. MD294 TaxID=97138 RepID=UPI0002CB8A78|nr:hypothetical protein [Clostridium sp. MD294]NDO45381.1 hypothetical protein [Clostridium sp. MD294]USF30978.1 hypothetical protein C820_002424 [Clostridium sp. MD294]
MYYYNKMKKQKQITEFIKIQYTILFIIIVVIQQYSMLYCIIAISVLFYTLLYQNTTFVTKQHNIKFLCYNLKEVLKDLPRHHFFQYCNKYSISNEIIQQSYQTVNNGYIYIVLSDTGTPASELISLFTKKNYNHASIAFDAQLKTLMSYNNGQNISPPGLNAETVQHLRKKEGACIIVYQMRATPEQKKCMISKIEKINVEGSSYNTIGLLLKHSFLPNIMFCSQFVYYLLCEAGIAYFDKKMECVTPMDFIELDYKRKLEFLYEKIL